MATRVMHQTNGQHRNQGDVTDKIHIDEERGFLLAELAFDGEETAIEGIGADTADRRNEIGPVFRSEGADFDPASIPQRFNFGIFG